MGQQEAGPARAGLFVFGGLGNCSVRFGFVCSGVLQKGLHYYSLQSRESCMHNISILISGSQSLCKRFSLEAGVISSQRAAMPKLFKYESRLIDGIEQFAALFTELEQDRSRFIVRGQLAEDVDEARPILRRLSRTDRSHPNDSPFIDTPAPWVMIDVDKLALPKGMSVREDTLASVEYAIGLLPAEFQDSSVFWQLSGSAGVFDSTHISAHLYYWLDKPIANDVLRQWAKRCDRRLVDPAVFHAVQPHYTASPLFGEGCVDPFPDSRSGLIKKTNASVCLEFRQLAAEPKQARQASQNKLDLNDDRVRGFSNILATLGDHDGGSGFNEPLLRAVASYVSKVGGQEATEQKDWLLDYLRQSIEEANQSSHSADEIRRYKSTAYLEVLLQGAIDKYGNNDQVPAYFDTTPLSIEAAEAKLEQAIDDFAKQAAVFNSSDENMLTMITPQLAIKATAGLGKTSRIIKRLIAASALKHGDVHYFVPTHRLSQELVTDLEAQLDFALPPNVVELLGGDGEGVYKRVRLISGRGQPDATGLTLCWKNDLAQKVAKVGMNVSGTLCKQGSIACEYYEQCGYQRQFIDSDLDVPKDEPVSELLWEVAVMTHDHMFLNTKDRLHKPGLIVVDESFYQRGITEDDVSPSELFQTQAPIARLLHEAILSRETQLLKKIRDRGYSAADLVAEAGEIESGYVESLSVSLDPALPESQQRILLKYAEPVPNATLIHRQLADEMARVGRDESHTVFWDESKEKIVVTSRRELTIPSYIPTVFIDADVQPEILKLFRDGVEHVEIPVERQATVHQFSDLSFSKKALLRESDKSSTLLKQIVAFTSGLAKRGRTLLVCSKAVRLELTKEDSKTLQQDFNLQEVTVTHFGSLRGVNKYEDYDNVVIVGREQPPAIACENQAKALWWDREEALALLPSKSGHKPLESESRGYRLSNGTNRSTKVQVHPDYRVQLVLEQIRESESTQALDRLRLLRDKGGDRRQVFILSSVPLDITVDHLWGWKRLQALLALVEEAGGVLPLNATHMTRKCPANANSIRSAERLAAEFKTASFLVSIYIRDVAVYKVLYRTPQQKRPSEALVFGDITTEEVADTLSVVAKDTVEIIEKAVWNSEKYVSR